MKKKSLRDLRPIYQTIDLLIAHAHTHTHTHTHIHTHTSFSHLVCECQEEEVRRIMSSEMQSHGSVIKPGDFALYIDFYLLKGVWYY